MDDPPPPPSAAPVQVCAFIGLCDGQGNTAALPAQAGQQMMQTSRRLLTDDFPKAAAQQASSVRVGDSPMCPFCTTAVTYIKARCLPLPVGCQALSSCWL